MLRWSGKNANQKVGMDKMPTTEISPDKMPTFGWHYVRLAFCPVGILSTHPHERHVAIIESFKFGVWIVPAALGRILLHVLVLLHLYHVLFPPALVESLHPGKVIMSIFLATHQGDFNCGPSSHPDFIKNWQDGTIKVTLPPILLPTS